jgi:hypothetical protein
MSMPRIGAGFLALSVLVAFAATGASAEAADASATPRTSAAVRKMARNPFTRRTCRRR